ncbi:MAG: response regulator [Candidatus Omnitrophota bacterium]|nr:response regulator [Candidatus Omnitrophota bacterium]
MEKAKILVIDDEKIITESIKMELEDRGSYEVASAANGREGIEMAAKGKFDIAYVDLIMPDISGVEVCRKIKEISPGTEVVMISGHYDEIMRRRDDFWEAGGRDEIMRKPFMSPSSIADMTGKIMEEKRSGNG